ncbi:MAG: SGNH/GDSL hydrolase family protein [Mucilaginibacter sp.]
MSRRVTRGKHWAVFIFLVVLALFSAEWGYRIFIKRKFDKIIALELEEVPCNYRVSASVHVENDSKYGEHPKANHTCWFTNVTNGKVTKGTTIFVSNNDKLDGRATLSEYKKAEYKILAFGDSYTHWNQDGDTWPDILQKNLNALKGKNVVVLNYARGAYGLLQMLDLAADKVDELKPDMVIFSVGRGNIANDRWWSYETKQDDYTRWILSSKNGEGNAYWYTNDLAQVTAGTTAQWCEKQIESPDPNDPVLKKANAQFLAMNEKKVKQQYYIPLFSWDHSYLLNRICGKSQFPSKGFIPQLKVNDFGADVKTANNIKRIKAAKVPVMMVYIPSIEEIKNKRDSIYYDKHKQELLVSLEKRIGKPFHFIQREYTCALPEVIDLRPFDLHPNHDGLQFYANAITPMVLEEIAVNGHSLKK